MAEEAQPASAQPDLLVDWVMALLGCWFVFGAYVVASVRLRPPVSSATLASWQQVVADSGWILVTAFLAGTLARKLSRGLPWQRALPPGYMLSLAGCAIFAMGASADTYWSLAFGFGTGLEALLGPAHIVEILGGGLMIGGPLRSAVRRGSLGLPGVISAGLVLSALTFATLFAHPYVDVWASASRRPSQVLWWVAENIGVASLFLQSAILLGLSLLLLRSFRPRPGTFTLIAALNGFMVAIVHLRFDLLPAMVATGVAIDMVALAVSPEWQRPRQVRLFAILVPPLYICAYLALLLLTGGTAWSWRLWLGIVLASPILGWLVARLVVPTAPPAAALATSDAAAVWPRHHLIEVSQDQVKDALEALGDPCRPCPQPHDRSGLHLEGRRRTGRRAALASGRRDPRAGSLTPAAGCGGGTAAARLLRQAGGQPRGDRRAAPSVAANLLPPPAAGAGLGRGAGGRAERVRGQAAVSPGADAAKAERPPCSPGKRGP